MPNHVINEIIFRDVAPDRQSEILNRLCDDKWEIAFEVLVPIPPNVWLGNVSKRHEKLGKSALDWCRENWGTKWGAYGQSDDNYKSISQTDDTLTLRFQTAWSPPYGWLVAVMNSIDCPFEHNWMSEGSDQGYACKWDVVALKSDDWSKEPWVETECDEPMRRHLHKMLWGVEEFEEEATD